MKKTKEQKQTEPIESSWKFWKESILGNDQNSISQQMVRAFWDDGVFRLILESWQMEREKNPNQPRINRPLYDFINRNYMYNQVTAIRRLSDKSSSLYGDFGVFSLYALINDIQSRRNEITRIKYFELMDIPYDLEETNRKFHRYIASMSEKWYSVPRELSVMSCQETHTFFDKISRQQSKQRSPDDLISSEIFDKMKEIFKKYRHIYDYASKNLAHAAIPESRELTHTDDIRISFQEIWDCHRDLYEIVDFLTKFLAGAFMQPLPVEDTEFYEFWDEPLTESSDMPKLKAEFLKFRKETESWGLNNDVDNWFRKNANN